MYTSAHVSMLIHVHAHGAANTCAVSNTHVRVITCPQAFGDVRHLHSTLKPRGVIVVTYFDLRAATNAVSTLDGTLIQGIPISVACAGAHDKELGHVNQVGVRWHTWWYGRA